ncbi:MAG TPA: hypothetical protein VGQ91_01940 [Ideonella sp.]|jgi:predicted  nucleic acid-binding Zn-ribbon protein|nr:hypothetical protein [Ideonella sp.]
MSFRGLAALMCALPLVALGQAGVASKALSGNTPGKGTLLTREELRTCIKEQQGQSLQATALEKRRGEIDAEAAAVRKQAGEVQAERDAYQAQGQAAQALKERLKAHGERVALYNQRFKEFQDNPPKGANAERERGQLEAEGAAVAQADAAIKSEAVQFNATLDLMRRELAAHAQAHSAAATLANEHNRAFNDEVAARDAAVEAWKQRCGNRPYRDADEKAVRAEK